MNRTVQHGVYDATWERYNNTAFRLSVHDRPEFHGMSHYDLRLSLDNEGLLDPFVVIDEKTPELNAIWYIDYTENCKLNSDPRPFGNYPPVRYPDEDFILWQAHLSIGDLPAMAASWSVVACRGLVITCRSLVISVMIYYFPYDPHGSQPHIITTGINWTNPENAAMWFGPLAVGANTTEVEWSADPNIVRLREETAREAGLVWEWNIKLPSRRPDAEVSLFTHYDWKSPLWPTGYPDDSSMSGRPGNLQLPGSRNVVTEKPRGNPALRQTRQNLCARLQQMRPEPHNSSARKTSPER
ncbi:MAG: hypothetical protein Q9181_003003 [Wetmoreana brouardii]